MVPVVQVTKLGEGIAGNAVLRLGSVDILYLIGDLALQTLAELGMRVDVTLDGLCASLLATEERVTVRKDDAIPSVEVDITVGNLDVIHVLAGVSVDCASGLVSARILASLV